MPPDLTISDDAILRLPIICEFKAATSNTLSEVPMNRIDDTFYHDASPILLNIGILYLVRVPLRR